MKLLQEAVLSQGGPRDAAVGLNFGFSVRIEVYIDIARFSLR